MAQTTESTAKRRPAEAGLAHAAVETVAAIDIGSNTIRMVIGEVAADGSIEVLERLHRAVRLGQDTFRRGRISGQLMRTAVNILRDYRRLLDFYQIERIRAVATSAVREAVNADTFLDRIYVATGIDLEIIDTSEETRLNLGALRRTVGDALGINKSTALFADVGGGSTLLTVLKNGELLSSQSLQLGSVRLQEAVATLNEPPERQTSLMLNQIQNTVSAVAAALPLKKARLLVVVGGDARFAARQAGKTTSAEQLCAVSRADFNKLVRHLRPHTPAELGRKFRLSPAEAETLVPALLVYQTLLEATAAPRLLVSNITMRDGLLLDLARSATGQEDEALVQGVIHSAEAIAEKYHADKCHARYVSETTVRLFDELQDEHGLSPRHRLLARVAGLVHEVGGFVASRAHHKHSYYLVANSEIFGLNRAETLIIAHVARYHRRGLPKRSHGDFMGLSRESRMVVSKLAALLRVADALDRAHAQQISDITFGREKDEFVVFVRGVADLTLERRAVRSKGDLFEDIYGMRVRVEEAGLDDQRRAKPYP
jgi:exopolyphosphatase/guanosine-5'-triphosphate,3'-diphosphate pyrophosphatase